MNGTDRFAREGRRIARFAAQSESSRLQVKDDAANYNVRKSNRMTKKGRV